MEAAEVPLIPKQRQSPRFEFVLQEVLAGAAPNHIGDFPMNGLAVRVFPTLTGLYRGRGIVAWQEVYPLKRHLMFRLAFSRCETLKPRAAVRNGGFQYPPI